MLCRPIDVLTDPRSAEIPVFGILEDVEEQVEAFEHLCCCRTCAILPVCGMRDEPTFQAGCSGPIRRDGPTNNAA